jgi:hypothetical protein
MQFEGFASPILKHRDSLIDNTDTLSDDVHFEAPHLYCSDGFSAKKQKLFGGSPMKYSINNNTLRMNNLLSPTKGVNNIYIIEEEDSSHKEEETTQTNQF